MSRAFVVLAATLAVWLPAAPALAWGPLTRGLVAERAYAELAPRMPWLTPQRDAFVWGAICADIQEAPGQPAARERVHAGYTVQALWRNAQASGDHGAEAFALGWASHVAADQVYDAFADNVGQPWLDQRSESKDAGPAPTGLLEWAVDSALLPRASDTLLDVARSAAVNAGTPAGAPIAAVVDKTLGIDGDTYESFARMIVLGCVGGPDHYLEARAHALRLGRWTEPAREPAARQGLGELTPWITRSVRSAVDRALALTHK